MSRKASMIETENLKLIPCDLEHFEAILQDHAGLEQMLGVSLADEWVGFPEAIPYGYEYLKANPDAFGWWMYLFIHAVDKTLIGLGGFKGKPDESGMVEIGYSIAPAYRNRGLAGEAARGMIDYAFSHPQVSAVDAHTLPEANPSTRVLQRAGMKKLESVQDPEHGEVWHWRLSREDYQKA
jgi:RimJ/RimL family protein N-acetyltransferase